MKTKTHPNQRISEAISIYGAQIVEYVRMFVDLFDADGMFTTFNDQGMYEHAECLEMIYFAN